MYTPSHEKIVTRSSAQREETPTTQDKQPAYRGSPSSRRSLQDVPVHRRKSLAGSAQLHAWRGPRLFFFAFAQLPFNNSAARPLQGQKTKNACEQQPRLFRCTHKKGGLDEERFSFHASPVFVFSDKSRVSKDHLYRRHCSSIFIKTLPRMADPFKLEHRHNRRAP